MIRESLRARARVGAAVLTVGAVLVGPSAVVGSAAANGATPTVAKTAGQLVSVECFGAKCIATGRRIGGAELTLAERFDGTKWSVMTTPNPPGSHLAGLGGLACTTLTNCIAVGSYMNANGHFPLAERWNGTKWTIMKMPKYGSGAGLTRVSCVSATNCWSGGHSDSDHAFFAHWNGTKWSYVPSANPTGGHSTYVDHVSCTAGGFCMAVGESTKGFFAERYNGTNWIHTPTPNPPGAARALLGVACTHNNACQAVGTTDVNFASSARSVIQRWNGKTWTTVASPNPASYQALGFLGVACSAGNACTAVGSADHPNSQTFAALWNGATWSKQPTPNPAGSSSTWFDGVDCPTATSCTAVGYSSTNKPVIEHWNGTTWAIQSPG